MAKLYFYYSAMNAGKSTMLLQSSHNYQERGMETLLLTPMLDTRDGIGKITARIGLAQPALPIAATDNVYQLINNQLKQRQKIKCILIDEAQFLTKMQVFQLSDVVDQCHVPVLAYGIRSDFQAEPFPGSIALLAMADELVEIKTICHCGRKAIMNMRIDAQGQVVRHGEQVLIGGNDCYQATCRRCFKLGAVDAASLEKLRANASS